MKEELEKLGFVFIDIWIIAKFKISDYRNLLIDKEHNVFIKDINSEEEVFLFPYNQEKLKQLIQLLS